MSNEFLQLSLMPMLIGALACMAAALLGNFLLLRRQSMMGDTISHVALPGIVAGFLLTGSVSTVVMYTGATVSAILAVALITLIRRFGNVEPGAAMGVVFTALFALGVLLLETSGARNVHLDVEHALYGNLESLIWLRGTHWGAFLDPEALAHIPPQVGRLALVLLAIVAFITAFWKELVIGTFDPIYAQSIGARPQLIGFLLLVLTAVTAVAAFDAVGSIIVIAMFICPPAAARLLTNSLPRQFAFSLVFAAGSAVLGYVLAGYGPIWLGARDSVSAAGMISVVGGAILALAALLGPKRKLRS